ncbi:class I SAM-dependent methyltransferase [Thermocrinis sp.]|uniref:class I SAM-dependent methyltransferase n=1 Tax=Thermocrinis sp. TaxID=2024383 RepID=UPI002FDD81AD
MAKDIVSEVFSSVSKYYDFFLNLVTFGKIKNWQRDMLSFLSKEGSILDIGTGTGEVLVQSKSEGLKVGIDISFEMLKIAKGKCAECYFILADAEDLPFKDNSFKNLTVSLVYRHLHSREKFLKEAKRVLVKDGRLAILDINRFWLTPVLVFLMRFPMKPIGIILFGKDKWDFFIHSLENSVGEEELRKELETAGFAVINTNRKLMGVVYITIAKKV